VACERVKPTYLISCTLLVWRSIRIHKSKMSPNHEYFGKYLITYLDTGWFSQLGDGQNGLRLTAGAREFPLRLHTHIRYEGQKISYLIDTEAFPPECKADGVKFATHSQLNTKLKMSGCVPPFRHSFKVLLWTTFTAFFHIVYKPLYYSPLHNNGW